MSESEPRRFRNEAVWHATDRLNPDSTLVRASSYRVSRVGHALQKELRAAWAACGAFEWWALGYLAVSSGLIAIFAENVSHPYRLLGTQGLAAAIILTLCRVEARAAARAESYGSSFAASWWHFWRHWYPHLFFLFCFEELGHLMTLVVPKWQDAKLIALDYWLTGVHPSVWLEQFTTPFRNDLMQLVYFTYFTYLLIVGGVLYYRKDWRGYWSAMTYSMVGYSIGYVMAMCFPVESPWFAMDGWWKGPLQGGPFTAMMSFIEHYGRVRGAAFPSAHVTGATAALWAAWKYRRWLFWVLLPLYAGMCVSTVWGRYHYCVDVFAGMIIGTIGYVVGCRLVESKGAVTTVQ